MGPPSARPPSEADPAPARGRALGGPGRVVTMLTARSRPGRISSRATWPEPRKTRMASCRPLRDHPDRSRHDAATCARRASGYRADAGRAPARRPERKKGARFEEPGAQFQCNSKHTLERPGTHAFFTQVSQPNTATPAGARLEGAVDSSRARDTRQRAGRTLIISTRLDTDDSDHAQKDYDHDLQGELSRAHRSSPNTGRVTCTHPLPPVPGDPLEPRRLV